MTTSNTLPPELLQTFLLDASDVNIQATYSNKENRISFEKWFSTLEGSISWIKNHVPLSLRVLRVISKECEQEEFLAVQRIYDVFRESLTFKTSEIMQFDEIAKEFLHKYFQSDRQGFERYLQIANETGSLPLHIAARAGDLEFFSFVEHHFPDLFEQLLKRNDDDLLNPLLNAFQAKKFQILKFVRERRPSIFIHFLETKSGQQERTPLLEAAASGDLEFFSYVYMNFSELYIRLSQDTCKGGFNCLHLAVENKHHHICNYIQSADPEIFNQLVKTKDTSNRTPLHYAVLYLNTTFIKKIKHLIPYYFKSFFQTTEPEIFYKILCGTNDKPRPLLNLIIQDDDDELLKLILQKEPELCSSILLTKDFPDYPDPVKTAFENGSTLILDLLYEHVPALFDKLSDISHVLSLVEELEESATIMLPYCRQFPVTTALIQTLFFLKDDNHRIAVNNIQANLALPHGQRYLEAIIQSDVITDFLCIQDDILTQYLDRLPDLDFLPWESGMDILVQLPPREIKNTLEHMDKETLDAVIDTKTFVQGDLDIDGSYLNYWWILKTVFERYQNILDDEVFLTIARDDLSLITPQGLAACCVSEDTEAMVKKLLLAIPDPHYRVVIPLLSIEEYHDFMQTIPLPKQLHYIRVSTGEQKQDFLNRFQLDFIVDIEIWIAELSILIEEINASLENPNLIANAKKRFEVLKKTWMDGQHHLTFLTNQKVMLSQLGNVLIFYENSEILTRLINTKLNRLIQQVKNLHREIKNFHTTIWETLANNIHLKEEPIPEEFFCPISGEIMVNPVVDPYGQSYEKEKILAWLEEKKTSPMTRKPLSAEDLKPNNELKARIQEFQKDKK